MKRLLVLIFVMAAMMPVCVSAQRRAKAAVPPLKEIVKEVFVKEFGMGQPKTVRITQIYDALTKFNILELVDVKSRPDTLYINFSMPSDGGISGILVWHRNGQAYACNYMKDLSYFDKYIRKYYERDNIEWYYENSYLVDNTTRLITKSGEKIYDIIYSWDIPAFNTYFKKLFGKVYDEDSDTFIRIIRNRDSYSFDSYTGYYRKLIHTY